MISEPWKVHKDGCIQVDNIKTVVKKGDWVIKGVWLEWLHGGRTTNWMTMTHNRRMCLVKLEQVLIPNLKVRPVSSDNPLPTGMRHASRQIAKQRGAWRISDEDNVFLLEESYSRDLTIVCSATLLSVLVETVQLVKCAQRLGAGRKELGASMAMLAC